MLSRRDALVIDSVQLKNDHMKLELDADAQMPLDLVDDEQHRFLIFEDDLTQTVRGKSFLYCNRQVGKEVEMVEALVSGCGRQEFLDSSSR